MTLSQKTNYLKLETEIAEKDTEIEDLKRRNEHLNSLLSISDTKNKEMTHEIKRLQKFLIDTQRYNIMFHEAIIEREKLIKEKNEKIHCLLKKLEKWNEDHHDQESLIKEASLDTYV